DVLVDLVGHREPGGGAEGRRLPRELAGGGEDPLRRTRGARQPHGAGGDRPDLDESNMMAVDYLDAIESELGPAPEITPQGGGEFENILKRAGEDVLFGNITAEEGGKRLVDELAAALS